MNELHDLLCFLSNFRLIEWTPNWRHKRIIFFIQFPRSSLWSSGQGSWLQIQRSGFDFRRYQIFWEVVGLERSPLSYVNTIEELLERKSSGSGQENRDYDRRDPTCWPRNTPLSAEVVTNLADKRWRSVAIVLSRIKAKTL
jgi:hypothetical protein